MQQANQTKSVLLLLGGDFVVKAKNSEADKVIERADLMP